MKKIGIICEYNPFHLGHRKQLDWIRRQYGEECAIVCLMSGNYVQRGAPAMFDMSLRARAAVDCGADLVLELPAEYVLSSAEGFAAGGVEILSRICDGLCFGSESGNAGELLNTAQALLSSRFPPLLRKELEGGLSFPAARQKALEEMGLSGVTRPNDILAVEYCKAILRSGSRMEPIPILRGGNYHDLNADPENPSATAVRQKLVSGERWEQLVPPEAGSLFQGAEVHTLEAGERAVLARLRTMTEAEFERLPHGSEGLWRKFRKACGQCRTLEEIMAATKSKRYTRTRLDRMMMCAFLGLEDLQTRPPYVRVLAFSSRGREILSEQKKSGYFVNAGQKTENPRQAQEQRWGDLYGLFAVSGPEAPGREEQRRVYFRK